MLRRRLPQDTPPPQSDGSLRGLSLTPKPPLMSRTFSHTGPIQNPRMPGAGAVVRGRWGMQLAIGDFLLGPKLGEGLTGRVHYARLTARACMTGLRARERGADAARRADAQVRGAECALKVMRKARLLEIGEERHVLSEVEALDRVHSRFVTSLLGAFQDSRALYVALELMPGPDLFAYMHELNGATAAGSAPLPAVRFYTAQVLLGLDALHSNGYVYRDLKPENVLMDGNGHLKVADLGFAKLVFDTGRAFTVCGTPDYLAPEVIEHRGATRGADYWALGILLFEFIAGFPPFQGEPKWYQFKKICEGRIEYWPDDFPSDARDLVIQLLQKQEDRRIGLLAGGVRDVQRHAFYKDLDWEALAAGSLAAPFTPDKSQVSSIQAVTPLEGRRIKMVRATARAAPPYPECGGGTGVETGSPARRRARSAAPAAAAQELRQSMARDEPLSMAQAAAFASF